MDAWFAGMSAQRFPDAELLDSRDLAGAVARMRLYNQLADEGKGLLEWECQNDDIMNIVNAYLAEHFEDDNILVDEDWLEAMGFESLGNNDRYFSKGPLMIIRYKETGPWCVYIDGCCGPEPLTRGHVRFLCKGLDIAIERKSS